MIITCPECLAKYRLEESLISTEGNRVRCSRCQHIFRVQKSESLEQPSPTIEVSTPGHEEKVLPKRFSRDRFFWVKGAMFIVILAGLGLALLYYSGGNRWWEKARDLKKLTFSIPAWGQSLMDKTSYLKNFIAGLPLRKDQKIKSLIAQADTHSIGKVRIRAANIGHVVSRN